MKASDYIAQFLAENGVCTVYEMTGGMITHLLDSLGAHAGIDVISMHHEQAAAFAAEAGARLSGVPGVALATSGPGATNLLTGIGSCFFDSVPAVFITGQVNTTELSGESGVRQAGFQETDIVSVAAPLTKRAMQVRDVTELPRALEDAFRLALSGRPGPVLLDLPMDIQRQDVEGVPSRVVPATPVCDSTGLSDVIAAIGAAKRPMVVAGGGVRAAGAARELRDAASMLSVPVALTLMGVDLLPYGDPLRVGVIGTYGNRWANLAMRDSDLLLVLGARLDVRQTGANTDAFREGKTLIRVDIDESQLAWRLPGDLEMRCDVREFLTALMGASDSVESCDRTSWLGEIDAHRKAWPQEGELSDIPGIDPTSFIARLSSLASDASTFVADVGQNQMWSAQSVQLADGQRFLTSGGMGAMGFALPSAIGAAISKPGSPVVAFIGDGGMQVNIQELETVHRLGLPVKIVVFNNRCLGMVRQFQDELFESRYQSTVWGYGTPDFVAVSEAYGIPARHLSEPAQVDEGLAWLMEDRSTPALLEVAIDSASCVRPKVRFGNPVFVMDVPVPPEDDV